MSMSEISVYLMYERVILSDFVFKAKIYCMIGASNDKLVCLKSEFVIL